MHYRIFILLFLCSGSISRAQDFYFDEPNTEFYKTGTFFFGQQWRGMDPLFSQLNFDILETSGAYDLVGAHYADSIDYSNRSNLLGLGFTANNIQCLMTLGFRTTSPYRHFNVGFGLGFNQTLHFSYKTAQPLIWFEGLLNYNFFQGRMVLRSFETLNGDPYAIIDGNQFPDVNAIMREGKYSLNLESRRHMIEPVAALNIALGKFFQLRGAVSYSFFLNRNNPKFVFRYTPDIGEEENSALSREKLDLDKNVNNINIDGNPLNGFVFDYKRINLSVALVLRFGGADTPPNSYQPDSRFE